MEIGKRWAEVTVGQRVFVHLPSIGLPQRQRSRAQDKRVMLQMEARQFGRICELRESVWLETSAQVSSQTASSKHATC
ncbi:unnamed protein product [Protopolystoma xenopodis]|uniref:Uncharacterized protein n=1 Tax=Protopolystoma xenopodis TaxID=117903 RepID=A0A3S5ATE6_9PLAT|nr:unnamed protein product [Protopolystoma xenopodis]